MKFDEIIEKKVNVTLKVPYNVIGIFNYVLAL